MGRPIVAASVISWSLSRLGFNLEPQFRVGRRDGDGIHVSYDGREGSWWSASLVG